MTAEKEQVKVTNSPRHRLLLALIILSAALLRLHLLDVPLERDEGEYAYSGQLLLQGIAPYAQAYNMKMPGVSAAYAAILGGVGQTHQAIHLGLLLVNAATTLLLFLLGRKLFDPFTRLVAAAVFALLSLGQWVNGMFANAEHFVILPAIGGILPLLHASESRKRSTLFAGALLLGLAFLMKQQGAAFIAFGGLYLFINEVQRRPINWKAPVSACTVYIAGVLLPIVVTCLLLWRADVFDKFWFWTFDYASQYVSTLPLATGMDNLAVRFGEITGSSILLSVFTAIGLLSFAWNEKSRKRMLFMLLFAVFSFLAICPGLYFRTHYFVLLLPAVALLAGLGAGSVRDLLGRYQVSRVITAVPALPVIVAVVHSTWQQRDYLFLMSPDEIMRSTYDRNPFPESLEIAQYLGDHSTQQNRIAIVGSEPQIYFYAKRRAATGYILTYPLMEPHPYALSMQQEMSSEIEQAEPEYLVFSNILLSWLMTKDSEKLIFEWIAGYTREQYDRVDVVDIGHNGTNYLWGDDARHYRIQSPYSLSVYKKKS